MLSAARGAEEEVFETPDLAEDDELELEHGSQAAGTKGRQDAGLNKATNKASRPWWKTSGCLFRARVPGVVLISYGRWLTWSVKKVRDRFFWTSSTIQTAVFVALTRSPTLSCWAFQLQQYDVFAFVQPAPLGRRTSRTAAQILLFVELFPWQRVGNVGGQRSSAELYYTQRDYSINKRAHSRTSLVRQRFFSERHASRAGISSCPNSRICATITIKY